MPSLREKGKEIGEFLKAIIRGAQGLPPEEDVFSGLIDVKDTIERSRMPGLHEVYSQEYMRLLKSYGGEEWKIYEDIAELDAKLFIPLEGEQRKEAILMAKAKGSQLIIPGQELTIPQVSTKPGEKEAKGKREK